MITTLQVLPCCLIAGTNLHNRFPHETISPSCAPSGGRWGWGGRGNPSPRMLAGGNGGRQSRGRSLRRSAHVTVASVEVQRATAAGSIGDNSKILSPRCLYGVVTAGDLGDHLQRSAYKIMASVEVQGHFWQVEWMWVLVEDCLWDCGLSGSTEGIGGRRSRSAVGSSA